MGKEQMPTAAVYQTNCVEIGMLNKCIILNYHCIMDYILYYWVN